VGPSHHQCAMDSMCWLGQTRAVKLEGLRAILAAAALLFSARRADAAPALLPSGPLIVGYQDWSACDVEQTVAVAQRGVNVVIWFAINLVDEDGQPSIHGGPNYTCVAEARATLEAQGLPSAHLVSVGGWDAPHPSTAFNGTEWFEAWEAWNSALPWPFDGLDWDLEGNDIVSAPSNVFTPEVLDLVVDMSTALKRAGYVVSMVPAQSYLDVTTSAFNRSLLNAYPDFHPDFNYHGLNCYAYILAASPTDVFDIVIVQLYESWSRAAQALQDGVDPSIYLQELAEAMIAGWTVDFNDPMLQIQGQRMVRVDASQLVIALSFGSSDGSGKSVAFLPDSVGMAYSRASPATRPRGYGFWNIALDYAGGPFNGTGRKVSLAAGINGFLHVRPTNESVLV